MLGTSSGSRISHQLLECNYYHRHHHRRHHRKTLGFCTIRIAQLSSFILRPPSTVITNHLHHHRLQQRVVSSSFSLHCKSPGEIPRLRDCCSRREDGVELPAEGFSPVAGGIVALGKFDALHVGHRELAIQASRIGAPYLLSFVGMAEVFGWEPRAPIVAKCDRRRILSSWASYCGNVVPVEFQMEFSSVRHLSPRQFVEKLSKELRVCGVVAGENYRFGYKAAGDASQLVKLCEEYGIGACIINSVMDKHRDSTNIERNDLKEKGQVSSTRVRHALSVGNMVYVTELLGRPHRLLLMVKDGEGISNTFSKSRNSMPRSCLLNLPPRDGIYENCCVMFGDNKSAKCVVYIDTTHIHLEMDAVGQCNFDNSQESEFLGIDFGQLS